VSPSKRMQIYLTEEQYRKLKLISGRKGSSMAQLLRDALDRYAETVSGDGVEDPLDGIVGMASSRSKDASERHDEQIYRKDW